MKNRITVMIAVLCSALTITPATSWSMNAIGNGALIGGGTGAALGLLVDGVAALATAASTIACDNDGVPAACKNSTSATTYTIIPLAMGAAGAAIGAFIGAAAHAHHREATMMITPFIDPTPSDVPTFGLSLTKSF